MDIKEIERIVRKEFVTGILESEAFIIAGNWKMNKMRNEVSEFLDNIKDYDFGEKNTVIIFPPTPFLNLFETKLRYSKVMYGIQNFYPKDSGSYTGEISLKMALDYGVRYAIVGHSERRTIFNECDDFLADKVAESLKAKVKPILCIGENLEERRNTDYKQKLARQIRAGLAKVDTNGLNNVIIAYEPIWAIGTGETATPEQVEETHKFIRGFLKAEYGAETGTKIPILYGGSVKPENVKDLSLAESVNGFLIGGASLDADSFKEINNILNGK